MGDADLSKPSPKHDADRHQAGSGQDHGLPQCDHEVEGGQMDGHRPAPGLPQRANSHVRALSHPRQPVTGPLASAVKAHLMIKRERLTATIEGDFVVFLIGMRINKPLLVHKWFPVAQAMPRMLKELSRQPELGFIHAEMWFSRTTVLVQYWRSIEQLLAYAKNKEAEHLPAWRAFNQAAGSDGAVGIWHETYKVSPGSYENVYVDMPPFGLGRAGALQLATGGKQSAAGRLSGQHNAP